jgi:uncharacterized protein YkwD
MSQCRGLLHIVLLGIVLAAVGTGSRPSEHQGSQVRLVRSSSGPSTRSLELSTATLYAKHDPWKAYLAGEQICPGGERTDLPPAREVATVACLVNYARMHRGLRPLSVISTLNGASKTKAKEIVRCESFAHSPCGAPWDSAARSSGYAGVVGENLYLATGPWGAPRVAVDAWLNSEHHRRNLFGSEWRDQGFAVLTKERFDGYSDVSIWVSVFGDRTT